MDKRLHYMSKEIGTSSVISTGAAKMHKLIVDAINSHEISREQYEEIINISLSDGVVDPQEQALLTELQDLIECKTIKIKKIEKEAAVCIIYDTEGKLLMLNRNHPPMGWCLPGGKIEPDETSIQGVVREVREETGIRLNVEDVEYVKEDVSITGLKIHVFKAITLDSYEEGVEISYEHDAFMWAGKKTIAEFQDAGMIAGKTIEYL